MPRRRRRSRSTPRRASTTASAARPPGTPSPSCATSRAATSSRRSSASPPGPGSPSATTTGGTDRPDREGRQALLGVMEQAVAFYHEELLSQPEAKRARQYLRSRGYEGDTVRQFRLGWAPESGRVARAGGPGARGPARQGGPRPRGPERAARRLPGPGHLPDLRPGGQGDRARGEGPPGSGRGGRPEVPQLARDADLLEKAHPLRPQLGQTGHRADRRGDHLRGLHRRHRLFHRRPAPGGRHLRDGAHRGALPPARQFAKRVVLAFDADAAGQSAAARFYEWERRHELEVAVAALPAGSDPADLAMSRAAGAEGGGRERQDASSPSGSSGRSPSGELKTGEGRARAAEAALAMVAEHPNELVRDQFLVTVSDRTRLRTPNVSGRASTRSCGPSRPKRTSRSHRPADRRAGTAERGRGGARLGAGRRGGFEPPPGPGPGARGAPGPLGPPASGPAGMRSCSPSASPRPWPGG